MHKPRVAILTALAGIFIIAFILATLNDAHQYGGWLLMGFFVSLAFLCRCFELLKGYAYTIAIFAAVSLAMYYPQYFISIGDFKLSKTIKPLMQVIMFGMGTGLGLVDFARVLKMPKGVIAGVLCHYIIMPTIAFTITKIFSFPAEVAAGIILIGSCPNGLASNVMTYLARANLALSVTLTAVSTMLAPFVTPFFMELLAGQYVEVDFWAMMLDILEITIIPIVAGLVFNHFLSGKFKWLDAVMPVFSMFAIALILVVITANGRNELLVVGPLLIFAVFIHNTSGYVLGYLSGKLLGMKERDCRTIAIEVGMQNGGLAAALALKMGKAVGLAAAIFGPMMNITGSSLALWWRSKPLPEDEQGEPEIQVKH